MEQQNRLEQLRAYIDEELAGMASPAERHDAYIHLYGVAQYCELLALRRGEDAELAAMAGMLHDLHTYMSGSPQGHARQGALLAEEILTRLALTGPGETEVICTAIRRHSKKREIHGSFDELLKDADVLHHCLYAPDAPISEKERERFTSLREELGMAAGARERAAQEENLCPEEFFQAPE